MSNPSDRTRGPIGAVYEAGHWDIAPFANVQLSFPSLLYDVADPAARYVLDPGGDWRFIAPFYTAYTIELRGEVTGYAYFAYKINGTQFVLQQLVNAGFHALQIAVMNQGDVLRFYGVDLVGFGFAVDGLHAAVFQVGH